MNDVAIAIQRLPHGADLALPAPATDFSAGADLVAAVTEPVVLAPGQHALIPTGFVIQLPGGGHLLERPAERHQVLGARIVLALDPVQQMVEGQVLEDLDQHPAGLALGRGRAQLLDQCLGHFPALADAGGNAVEALLVAAQRRARTGVLEPLEVRDDLVEGRDPLDQKPVDLGQDLPRQGLDGRAPRHFLALSFQPSAVRWKRRTLVGIGCSLEEDSWRGPGHSWLKADR